MASPDTSPANAVYCFGKGAVCSFGPGKTLADIIPLADGVYLVLAYSMYSDSEYQHDYTYWNWMYIADSNLNVLGTVSFQLKSQQRVSVLGAELTDDKQYIDAVIAYYAFDRYYEDCYGDDCDRTYVADMRVEPFRLAVKWNSTPAAPSVSDAVTADVKRTSDLSDIASTVGAAVRKLSEAVGSAAGVLMPSTPLTATSVQSVAPSSERGVVEFSRTGCSLEAPVPSAGQSEVQSAELKWKRLACWPGTVYKD